MMLISEVPPLGELWCPEGSCREELVLCLGRIKVLPPALLSLQISIPDASISPLEAELVCFQEFEVCALCGLENVRVK